MSDKYGYILQIIVIDNGYANFKDDEENLCQIDDKYNQPEPIPLTPEILEKNGFSSETFLTAEWDYKTKAGVAEAFSKTNVCVSSFLTGLSKSPTIYSTPVLTIFVV